MAKNKVVVKDSRFFTDGMGLIPGDIITVGDDVGLQVDVIDYAANTLTLDRNITWGNGENVSFSYKGLAPDIGAIEFVSSFTSSNRPAPPSDLLIISE